MSKDHLIVELSEQITDTAGIRLSVLSRESAGRISSVTGKPLYTIYREALEEGVHPLRFIRNRNTITTDEQLVLSRAVVAVAGAGGLGGNVLMLLARLGIGSLIVIDSDSFDETNLNRQAFCTEASIGSLKALEAERAIAEINPGVSVRTITKRLGHENAIESLQGADMVVDCLDTIKDRFMLEEAAKALGIPLVHGAIAGFEGQVMTVFPEDRGIELIYGKAPGRKRPYPTPEAELGVPAVTASIIAGMEVMEVIKVLLKKGEPVRNEMLYVDVLAPLIHRVTF